MDLRKLLSSLKGTPFHPQWLVFKNERKNLKLLCESLHGRVLDIGCAHQKPKNFLSKGTEYIGLDYYATATQWYSTQPQVFGDAQSLPIVDACCDYVLLLDVLEHLPEPESSIQEIYRILKPTGTLIIQTPFIYPIHDAPLDFHRWTVHGLQRLAERYGFTVMATTAYSSPLESAALLTNIALSKTTLNWLKRKNPLGVFLLFTLPVLIPSFNLLAWTISKVAHEDYMMASGYQVMWKKR